MDDALNLMVITAHVGDWVIRTGGTIAKYVRAGHRVRVLALTWGQYSESATRWNEDPGRGVEDVIAIRRAEGEEAATLLGAELRAMGWDDGQLALHQERIEAIRHEIGLFRPDTILTHPLTDHNHPDHVTTAQAVRLASRYVGARREHEYPPARRFGLYYIEPTAPSPPYADFRPDVYVDISEVFEVKMQAVAVINRTQPTVSEYYGAMARQRGREAAAWSRRSQTAVTYAEAFMADGPFTTDILP